MSSEEEKSNPSHKKTFSQETSTEKTIKIKNISKNKSIPEELYQNSLENVNNMIELRQNLEKGDYKQDLETILLEFQKGKEQISKLDENEENMNKIIQEDNDLELSDDLFEERTLKILSDVYGLKEYNLYPIFDFGHLRTKKANVIKIYFNQIELSVENEKPSFSDLFLGELDTYMFQFLEMPMIFHKYNEDFFSLTVISKDFKNSIDFEFRKKNDYDKFAATSFIFAEINEDLMETKTKIKELKNKNDSSDDEVIKEIKDLEEKKLDSYQKILKLQEKIYSENTIKKELATKREELLILEEYAKIRELEDHEEKIEIEERDKRGKEEEKNINKLKEEINRCEQSLKEITVKIERKETEIEGLFFSSKEIILKNTIGDELKIPEKKAVIIEVKNMKKYKTMVENILNKKKLMKTFGFKTDLFYFIGILRGIDINKVQKQEINDKFFKDSNMKNMIIIYPEKLNFLNIPLIEIKNEVKEEPKKDTNLSDMLMDLINAIRNIQKDINIIKEKIK